MTDAELTLEIDAVVGIKFAARSEAKNRGIKLIQLPISPDNYAASRYRNRLAIKIQNV